MMFRSNRCKRVLLFICITVAAVGVSCFFLFRSPADIREALAVRAKWAATSANGDEVAKERLAKRSLEIAAKYPGTVGGLLALQLAATGAPETVSGRQALQEFANQVATADIGNLAQALERRQGPWGRLAEATPAMLARARKSADDPRAGRLAAAICVATRPDVCEACAATQSENGKQPCDIYVQAANLIRDDFAASPHIVHFCESLRSQHYSQPWTAPFEPHLRAILAVNQDRAVRCTAQYALATVVGAQETRRAEAQELFEQFCSEFDGKHAYPYRGIEEVYLTWAKSHLDELRHRVTGMSAPDIAGIDLEGRPMTLSEHRGKVVLLTFWATWCGPCMKLIPHERELAAQFEDKPFAIIGVNSDDDIDVARQAVAENQVTWRSFRDKYGEQPAISNDWKIIGYPSVFLIDHHGTIRKRWIESPSPDDLQHMIEVLVDAAQRAVPLEHMGPVVASLSRNDAAADAPEVKQVALPRRSDRGFLDQVYRAPDGTEAKCVVFLPHDYDGSKPYPAIVYLHGAGSRGSDGRLPTQHGLGKAIRERDDRFPFIVIFPQALEGEDWTAGSTGGERALAIVDQMQEEYRIDADRVALTGISMGGQGTWSLAAADPARWAAIVPICHGWRTDVAGRLKDLPCWCFHGEDDQLIPAQQSREMILAIQATGGRPFYTELSGVGHDDCADSAYSMPDLWDWLLMQNRAKR